MCKSAPVKRDTANEIDKSSKTELGIINIDSHSGGVSMLDFLEVAGFMLILLLVANRIHSCMKKRRKKARQQAADLATAVAAANAIPMTRIQGPQQAARITYAGTDADFRSFSS